MSKHESWRTRAFAASIDGELKEEYVVQSRTNDSARRLIDGVVFLTSERVVCIQTKGNRLGMNVLGQARYSAMLLARRGLTVERNVVVVGKDDAVLRELAAADGIEVVVCSDESQ